MSGLGTRPRNSKPAAGQGGKKDLPQPLRVLSEDGAARAVPSIAMPRAKTELSELLAGDKLLCVRPRASTSTRQNGDAGSGGADGKSHAASSRPSGQQKPDGSLQAQLGKDLARVIEAWPSLPRNIRAAILAMIRETVSPDQSSS